MNARTSATGLAFLALVVLALCVVWPARTHAQATTWTQRVATGPSPRGAHAMAYDSARGVTVLFGGYNEETGASDETWEWNGTLWTQRMVSGPSARILHAMAYDPARGVVVLFGGAAYDAATYSIVPLSDTWEWNGTTWTRSEVVGPAPTFGHAMIYDAARGHTLLFGGGTNGQEPGSVSWLGGTWEWNGAAWTQREVSGPSPRSALAMSYDARRDVAVVFGGEAMGPLSDETWQWNGSEWTHAAMAGPSGRSLHAMVYDGARGVSVLFGGNLDGNVPDGETWECDGAGGGAWTQRALTGPSPRFYHAMAFDAARRVTVLFGGGNYDTGSNGETWELGAGCAVDYDHDGALNPDDLGDFITDFYTPLHLPGPGGYAVACPDNEAPYDAGYRTAFTADGAGQCNPPSPDNLGDYVTAYYQGC
ncbi:MAG: hypothetical protein ACKVS8_11400 [Phycisphaerales bacterium]